jgi:hypothetical protein
MAFGFLVVGGEPRVRCGVDFAAGACPYITGQIGEDGNTSATPGTIFWRRRPKDHQKSATKRTNACTRITDATASSSAPNTHTGAHDSSG